MFIGNYYDLDLGMTDRNPDEFSSSSIESRGSISSQNYMGALQQWCMEELKRLLEEGRLAEKEAAEKDKAKSLATIEKAEA
ncbi:hypothetical protein L1887_04946 [Cichorium endivia]|nr:hypothetical protein L1887_04946 [Cichorium endivia]